jgi:hypothetical protein
MLLVRPSELVTPRGTNVKQLGDISKDGLSFILASKCEGAMKGLENSAILLDGREPKRETWSSF